MHTNGIVGCGKNNLAYNDAEAIELPIVFVSEVPYKLLCHSK